MPDLPASGVWQVSDYSGMGGFHWRPPIDSLELGIAAGAKSWTMKAPGGSCQCKVKTIAAGKFGGDYAIGDDKGDFEVEPQADGSLKIEFLGQSFSSYGNTRSGGVIVSATKGTPTVHSARPTLLDKKRFFVAVLGNRWFRENGILFGEDPTVARDAKWMVLDPNRHKLTIWEKPGPTSDFVTAGQAQDASVFTNGPMLYNKLGRPATWTDALAYAADGAIRRGATLIPFAHGPGWDDTSKESWTKAAADRYGSIPCGDVTGTSRGINAVAPPPGTNRFGYFGRGQGTGFASYKIGNGNPTGLVEAAGGLYPPVLLGGKFTADGFGRNQWLYWGLAPLQPDAADEVGLKRALEHYAVAMKVEGVAAAAKPVAGLIIALAYNGDGTVVQHLVDAGVTDAVKVDGNDSVLFGHHTKVLWGDAMTDRKRVWLNWGFAFHPY